MLTINGTNVINAATIPESKRTIGLFAFVAGSDGQSNVGAPLPAFFSLPFIQRRRSRDPRLTAAGREDLGSTQGEGPRPRAGTGRISVQLNDFE